MKHRKKYLIEAYVVLFLVSLTPPSIPTRSQFLLFFPFSLPTSLFPPSLHILLSFITSLCLLPFLARSLFSSLLSFLHLLYVLVLPFFPPSFSSIALFSLVFYQLTSSAAFSCPHPFLIHSSSSFLLLNLSSPLLPGCAPPRLTVSAHRPSIPQRPSSYEAKSCSDWFSLSSQIPRSGPLSTKNQHHAALHLASHPPAPPPHIHTASTPLRSRPPSNSTTPSPTDPDFNTHTHTRADRLHPCLTFTDPCSSKTPLHRLIHPRCKK